MTVGFLLNTCEPFYRGGYERRAWSFARELARLGHDVRVYTSCPRDETIDGVRFVRLVPPRAYFNARGVRNGWADLLFACAVLKLLRKLKPGELDAFDICATPFLHLPAAAFVARIKKIPAVLTCHEGLLYGLAHYAKERGYKSEFARALVVKTLSLIYRLGMGLFPRRIAVSRRTAVALEKEGYPGAEVVEFGLEPEAFSPDPPAPPEGKSTRFIFCGRLTPIKQVLNTVVALADLNLEGKFFRFDIVGEGSQRQALEREIRESRLETMITFHGEVGEAAKRELLARAEVFVLSSPREGFSIATLEAMAQGCAAVVVSDPQNPNGALDFVRDRQEGLVVLAGTDSLAAALTTVADDPALRLELRRAAWQAAHAYRIETQAAKLAGFLRG